MSGSRWRQIRRLLDAIHLDTMPAMHREDLPPVTVDNARRVAELIGPSVLRTSLRKSKAAERAGTGDVFLKCENLQPTDSFKVRGALSAVLGYRRAHPEIWAHMQRHGVVTCSSGNFAQGMAYATLELGLDYTVIVPHHITPFKLDRIQKYNPTANVVCAPLERWRAAMIEASYPGLLGFFVSSESDPYVSLGNSTIALEILEDLPEVDAILVPFGGGHLAYSIAALLRSAQRKTKVFAVEVSTGAPLAASIRAGKPVMVEHRESFVDGIGASFIIPWQFQRLRDVLSGVLSVTPREIAIAISSLARADDLLLEGAGAAAFAAALKYAPRHGWKTPCAVVTGGAIDPSMHRGILETVSPTEMIMPTGETP